MASLSLSLSLSFTHTRTHTQHKLRQNEVQRRVPQTGWDQKKTKEPVTSKVYHMTYNTHIYFSCCFRLIISILWYVTLIINFLKRVSCLCFSLMERLVNKSGKIWYINQQNSFVTIVLLLVNVSWSMYTKVVPLIVLLILVIVQDQYNTTAFLLYVLRIQTVFMIICLSLSLSLLLSLIRILVLKKCNLKASMLFVK